MFLLLWTSVFVVGTLAGQVTYKVVANPPDASQTIGVAVGEDVYPLKPHTTIPLLYEGRGPNGLPYRYVILSNTKTMTDFEPFERPAIENAHETFNEVYGRPWNKLELETLPQLYNFTTNKDPGRSKLYREGTIATLHLEAPDVDIMAMHTNKMEKKVKVSGKLTYINYDNIQQVDDVVFKVGGHSSRNWAKVPYKIKIPASSAKGLHHRWDLKLRSESTDPTMMREKLYQDLLKATGVLGPRGAYVRLYMNRTPVGLYLLVDDSGSESFIRETFHHDNKPSSLGSMVMGDAGKGDYAASMGYLGDDLAGYDDKVYNVKMDGVGGGDSAMIDLVQFFKYIESYQADSATSYDAAIQQWQDKFDMTRFLRQEAVEWIGGNWDGVQYSGNNYVMYRNPTSEQYTMVPTDFDYTFGNGLEDDQRNLLTGKWADFTNGRNVHSFLWEKVKQTLPLRKAYEDTLKDINDHLSSPDVLFKRIDSLAYFLQREIVWDHTLERMTLGLTRNWTAADFLPSLEKSLGDADLLFGLKEWVRVKHDSIAAELGTTVPTASK